MIIIANELLVRIGNRALLGPGEIPIKVSLVLALQIAVGRIGLKKEQKARRGPQGEMTRWGRATM